MIILNDEKIVLGRGHESDVRINDISVSRAHATLTFNKGKICVRDLKSKFGTLALIKNYINMKENRMHLQIGRSYLDVGLMNFKDFERLRANKYIN